LTLDEPFGVSPYSLDEVWAITRSLSPRAEVRAAARAATGEVLNSYDRLWPLDEPAPSTTWAMLLTDEDLRFRYLCFDFDAKGGNAIRDAGRMSHWLDELNIPHLVCISGPSGGRHVWVRLGEPAEAKAVHDLASLAKDLLPSLDRQPLTNPASGCVRPPYAPHRDAGYSLPLGDLRFITEQEAAPEAMEQLRALLVDLGAELPAPNTALPHGVVAGPDGQPRIRGPKRALSPRMDEVLHGAAGDDASHTLSRILIACANARWAYSDAAVHVISTPSFEHARSRRVGPRRIRRTPAQTTKVLEAAWRYAVNFVATHPLPDTGDDPEYRERTASVFETVDRVLARADALPGMWATHNGRVGGTHSQRAVLDALCMYMLQSSQHVVEADVRRLAADTGYGRTTVHTALRALAGGASAPWIELIGEAEGVNAQRYRLHHRFSTEEEVPDRTQARMRADRLELPPIQSRIREISERLELLAHDVFCAPRSLGRVAGLIYKLLPQDGELSVMELAKRSGVDPGIVRRKLERLTGAGLTGLRGRGFHRHSPAGRDFVARGLAVEGYLDSRRQRYESERKVWAWWLAEIQWMEIRGKRQRGKKPGAWSPKTDRPEYAEYPRGPGRRGDHVKAMQLVRSGYLDQGFVMVA
jgi:DNA-binding transcriptional ArsR family regulator